MAQEFSDNPYTPPQSEVLQIKRKRWTGLHWARVILYVHLVGIICCAIVVMQDAGKLPLADPIRFLFEFLVPPMLLTVVICPIAMFPVALSIKNRSAMFQLFVFVCDVLLSVFQCWILLPGIQ